LGAKHWFISINTFGYKLPGCEILFLDRAFEVYNLPEYIAKPYAPFFLPQTFAA